MKWNSMTFRFITRNTLQKSKVEILYFFWLAMKFEILTFREFLNKFLRWKPKGIQFGQNF
jgi:hypothetical protein